MRFSHEKPSEDDLVRIVVWAAGAVIVRLLHNFAEMPYNQVTITHY